MPEGLIPEFPWNANALIQPIEPQETTILNAEGSLDGLVNGKGDIGVVGSNKAQYRFEITIFLHFSSNDSRDVSRPNG